MPVPGPGYSITVRVEAPASSSAAGDLTTAVGRVGGVLTAFDVVESHSDSIVVDISANALSENHANDITQTLDSLPGVKVRKVSDRTFLIHLGGKIEVTPKVALRNRDDLSRAYTPGVARVCQAIAANPEDARRLTIKRNTVAVVTDGSAVLGLGNIGPAAALPVMEGKAALFKKFADVDAWPVCLDTQDTEEIIKIVKAIAPVYAGINLEDIAAPRCFEIEKRLREQLDIPVFHDDQHGTAIVVVAALRNALRVVKKNIEDCKIVVSGVGAAGSAIIRLLLRKNPGDIVAADIDGIVHSARGNLDDNLRVDRVAHQQGAGQRHPARGARRRGRLHRRLGAQPVRRRAGRDDEVRRRSSSRWPTRTRRSTRSRRSSTRRSSRPAAATSRTRSTTCWPSRASSAACSTRTRNNIDDEMLLAAADAIADVVDNGKLNASFIVPSVFDSAVAPAVADAVRKAVRAER